MNCTLDRNFKNDHSEKHQITHYSFDLEWTLSNFDIYTGVKLNFDQFIVNSFIFIDGEPLFVISVDNFGIMVIDIVSKMVVDKICFNWMNFGIPSTFSISKLIPVNKNGIRILLKDRSGFSLFWSGIAKIGDQEHVFINLTVSDVHLNINDGFRTNLIDFSKSGYSRVILKPIQSSNLYQATIKTFFYNFHQKSKLLNEIDIGRVSSWVYLSHKFTLNRIVLVWGSKIYLIHMIIYPLISIDKKSFYEEYSWSISSSNIISEQILQIKIKNDKTVSFQTRWMIALLFVILILFSYLLLDWIYQRVFNMSAIRKPDWISITRSSIKNNIKDKWTYFANKEESLRSTPRFDNPNDENEKITENLILKKERSTSDEPQNSLRTNILFTKIRQKNKIDFIQDEEELDLKEIVSEESVKVSIKILYACFIFLLQDIELLIIYSLLTKQFKMYLWSISKQARQ